MKIIHITQNHDVLVDDSDYEWLNQWKWQYRGGYAIRTIVLNKKKTCVGMHVVIMSPSKGFVVDHIDGNKLNNQRENLRICTYSLNKVYSKRRADNRTGYKGVTYHKSSSRFIARIVVNKSRIVLGSFDNPEDAARAYDKAALEHYGAFSILNFDGSK